MDSVRRHNEAQLSTLKPGDIIQFPRTFIVHYGLYAGNSKVIHMNKVDSERKPGGWRNWISSSSSSSFGDAKVTEDDFFTVAQDKKASKVMADDVFLPIGDGEEVVNRARRKMREQPDVYDVIRNNCEHFVFWCRYNVKISFQVLRMGITFLFAFMLIRLEQIRMVKERQKSETERENLETDNERLRKVSESLDKEKKRMDEICDERTVAIEEERLREEKNNLDNETTALERQEQELRKEQRKLEEKTASLGSIAFIEIFSVPCGLMGTLAETKAERKKFMSMTIESIKSRRSVIAQMLNAIGEVQSVIEKKQELVKEIKEIITDEVTLMEEEDRLKKEEELLKTEQKKSNKSMSERERNMTMRESLVEMQTNWVREKAKLVARKESWSVKRGELGVGRRE